MARGRRLQLSVDYERHCWHLCDHAGYQLNSSRNEGPAAFLARAAKKLPIGTRIEGTGRWIHMSYVVASDPLGQKFVQKLVSASGVGRG